MFRFFFPAIVLLAVASPTLMFSQQSSAELDSIKKKFESFDYKSVISLSDKILVFPSSIASTERIEILRMRGIVQYSLWDENSARESFKEILRINNQYELDSLKNSPKIVSLFKSVKKEFNLETAPQKKEAGKINIDSLLNYERHKFTTESSSMKAAFTKSLILPGWGHLHNGNDLKGWLLISAAAITFGSSIYFSVDAYNKEKEYLSATVQPAIEELYKKYNSSYKLRNISLISFAVVWIYSQIDLAYLSNNFFQITSASREKYINSTPFKRSSLIQFTFPF
ncbi:MAG: hypothetical protein KJ666_14235 [Bacteroidetes bacterium]|nr:hypothetical protein [Bacteroidota bacterium]MBU2586363.1 hypothetical protein [Bacteroidota bacterium]